MIKETACEPLSDTPVIAGLSFRRFLGPQDYPAMTAIINAANVEDGVEEVEGVEEVTNEYSHLANCDPSTDMLFVEVEGTLVGFTRVWWRVDEAGNRLYWHLAYLDPAWHRRGLGRDLIVASLRALQRRGMTEAVLGVDSDSLTGALRLYETTGFRTIARDMVMRKPFT